MFYTYSRLRVSVNHLVAEGQFTIEHTSGARAARPGALPVSRCGAHGWGVLVLLEAIVIRPTCSLSTHTAVSIREGRSQESGRRNLAPGIHWQPECCEQRQQPRSR